MKPVNLANINLWGRTIGTLIWQNDLGYFSYNKAFQASGIELSPLTVPLSDRVFSFNTLTPDTYKRLPGLLADSLPDKFGNQLIDQWLALHERKPESFSPLERLCYIGSRGMGALEFSPALGELSAPNQALDVAELVTLASQALSRKAELQTQLAGADQAKRAALERVISVGTSAGGARAKAVIAWNETTNEVRSGQVNTDSGFSYWLLKFDGISDNRDKEQLADPVGFGILEYAYHLMAVAAGINMSRCRLLKENGRAHFMTERFDRLAGGEKLHMLTLCGMAHFDFNQPGAYSYEQALAVMRELNLPHSDLEQLYRRALFNVMAKNQDDHTKNIAFLMDKTGTWRLAPAYDLTYCNGAYWTAQHQMSLNGKRDGFERSDFQALARHANLRPAQAQRIFDEVLAAIERWPDYAKRAQLPQNSPDLEPHLSWADAVGQELRIKW